MIQALDYGVDGLEAHTLRVLSTGWYWCLRHFCVVFCYFLLQCFHEIKH